MVRVRRTRSEVPSPHSSFFSCLWFAPGESDRKVRPLPLLSFPVYDSRPANPTGNGSFSLFFSFSVYGSYPAKPTGSGSASLSFSFLVYGSFPAIRERARRGGAEAHGDRGLLQAAGCRRRRGRDFISQGASHDRGRPRKKPIRKASRSR